MRIEVLMMTMIMVIFKTFIIVIYKTMTMVIFEAMMMVVMTRVTQSGSRLCRKFPFLLFALFSPSGRWKTTKTARFSILFLRYFCIFSVCLSYFRCLDKWRVRKLANSSLTSQYDHFGDYSAHVWPTDKYVIKATCSNRSFLNLALPNHDGKIFLVDLILCTEANQDSESVCCCKCKCSLIKSCFSPGKLKSVLSVLEELYLDACIPHIYHFFSTEFVLAKFVSTQKCVNNDKLSLWQNCAIRDKTNFSAKQHKLY